MKHSVVKNWIESFELITHKPFILKPFLLFGALEGLLLIALYFASGFPFNGLVSPVVRKYFGERFIHYPGNVTIIPKLFHFADILLFILVGVFLYAVAIRMLKGVKKRTKKPQTKKAIFYALRRYMALVIYGVIIVSVAILAKKYGALLYQKFLNLASRHLPQETFKLLPLGLVSAVFFLRIFANTFLILTLPIIIIKERPLIKSIWESIFSGITNFFKLFILISIPYVVYVPLLFVRNLQFKLAKNTFPEIIFLLALVSVFIYKLIDCFVYVCASRFVIERDAYLKMSLRKKGRKK